MKSKFLELFDKYVDGSLSRKEYDDFLDLLKNKNNVTDLDKQLDTMWDHDIVRDRKTTSLFSGGNHQTRHIFFGGLAASVLVFLAFAAWYVLLGYTTWDYEMYQTDFGEVKELILPDGSEVKLNANSTISWDKAWEKIGKRQVVLTGEAFFDIQTLPGKVPFVVEIGNLSLEVIGTSFNVDNRSKKIAIYLDEGRLNVHLQNTEIEVIKMIPGDKVLVDSETNEVAKETNRSLSNSASWKNGILNFKDMKLAEVLTKLTDIYGKTFVCSNKALLDKDIYLGVPFASWDIVKQALALSLGIEFIEINNLVEIKPL